jgi:hypothetical protein
MEWQIFDWLTDIWGSYGGEDVDCDTHPENEGNMFLGNVCNNLKHYTLSQP